MVDFVAASLILRVGGSCECLTDGNGSNPKKKVPVIPAWSLAVVMNDDEWFREGADSSVGREWRQTIIVIEVKLSLAQVDQAKCLSPMPQHHLVYQHEGQQIFATETRSEFTNHELRWENREFSRVLPVRSWDSGQSFSVGLFWNIEDGFSRTSNLWRKSGYFWQSWLNLLHKSMKTTTGCQNHNSVSSRSNPKLFIHVNTYRRYVQGPGSTDHTFGYFDKVLSHFSVFKHQPGTKTFLPSNRN